MDESSPASGPEKEADAPHMRSLVLVAGPAAISSPLRRSPTLAAKTPPVTSLRLSAENSLVLIRIFAEIVISILRMDF
jgi:hypothetical protein